MKKYVVHNNKIYYVNCKKDGDKYTLSGDIKNIKDVTNDVLYVVRDYLVNLKLSGNFPDDPAIVYSDGSGYILRLEKVN